MNLNAANADPMATHAIRKLEIVMSKRSKMIFSGWYLAAGFTVALLTIASPAIAQGATSTDDSKIELTDGVHVCTQSHVNIMAVVGSEGVLVTDSGYARDSERLVKSIDELQGGPVKFVLNTHFHFDHVGGNGAFAEKGAVIVAHQNGRLRMQEEWGFPETLGLGMPHIPPYPEVMLPTLTFSETLTLHFGRHEIETIHLPNAHSDADLVMLLPDANILYTGDLYLSNGFPLVDSFHGGTIDGLITAVGKLIDLINDDTQIVPGHGPMSNRQELREYQQMLITGRSRIAELVAKGMTMEEVLSADPTAGVYTGGESWLSADKFTLIVYADLARTLKPAAIT